MTAYIQPINYTPFELETKWNALLECIKPGITTTNARIADIMHGEINGEDTTGRKLKLIAEKEASDSMANPEDDEEENEVSKSIGCDMCEGSGTPGQMYACDDCYIPCPGCSGGYEDDGYEMTQRFLNGLSKERLIELILMTEEQRDHAINTDMDQDEESNE
jgi:hypothetical protein